MNIKGSCALVTGGGSGLGLEIVKTLLDGGVNVAIQYFTSEQNAQRVVKKAHPRGLKAACFKADLRSSVEIKDLLSGVEESLGPVQILINNASVLQRTPFDQLDERNWDDVFALNLKAVAFLSSWSARIMVAQGKGKIINIGDLAGIEPWPAYLAHASSKAAVHHLTRCMALALAPTVQVNAIAPGLIDPPPGWSEQKIERFRKRIRGGYPATAEDIAKTVLHLIENDALTGQIIAVDKGQSLSF